MHTLGGVDGDGIDPIHMVGMLLVLMESGRHKGAMVQGHLPPTRRGYAELSCMMIGVMY